MDHRAIQKQWWAPVWKGLVMDEGAKHYRRMKAAVWLYLYFLLNANRRTGVLMRKLDTVSRDMGVTRDTVLRWLNALRASGYVETVNTGRSLIIQVTRWKALAGAGKAALQKPGPAGSSRAKHPTPLPAASRSLPLGIPAGSGLPSANNETNIQIYKVNDLRRGTGGGPVERGFTAIGTSAYRALLAQELARRLNDPAGINLYRSYVSRYPEPLLMSVLKEVEALPQEYFTKGRGALFNYLVQLYAK